MNMLLLFIRILSEESETQLGILVEILKPMQEI